MFTKEQLRDWLDQAERDKRVEAIEKYLAKEIKKNALKGNHTFYVSTGEKPKMSRSTVKSSFYDIWHNEDLTEESSRIIKDTVIRKLKEFGFDASIVNVDHGYHSSYEAVMFRNIHETANE